MNHPCDGQTDRQTDGIAIAYARLQHSCRAQKCFTGTLFRKFVMEQLLKVLPPHLHCVATLPCEILSEYLCDMYIGALFAELARGLT